MKRRDPTILIALLLALGAHLIVLAVGVRAARREMGWWLQMPPAQAKAAPPPVTEPAKPPDDPMQQLGDHKTTGTSINTSPGDQPMESAQADARQEQAMMQRDPAGFGGKGTNRQLDQTLRGDNGDAAPKGSSGAAQTVASVFGSRESGLSQSSPKVKQPVPVKTPTNGNSNGTDTIIDPLSSGPLAIDPAKQKPAAPPSPTDSATNGQPSSQQNPQNQTGASSPGGGQGGRPGAPEPGAGNPMPTSDFESYPVTHIASRFLAGRIEARTGRKHLMRRLPDLSGPAARADLASMENPYVVLVLSIDETGTVTDAEIEHSSGSNNVDDPCRRAAYTWWFEPLKDPKTGKNRSETIEFTIYF